MRAGALLGLIITLIIATPASGASVVVDTNADSAPDALPNNGCEATLGDECTLREAILRANTVAGLDEIFLPGAPNDIIAIAAGSPLPAITEVVEIGNGSGFIQAEIRGPGAGAINGAGLTVNSTASGSEIAIVAITGFDSGIVVNGADDVDIVSTRVGIQKDGTPNGNGDDASDSGIRVVGDADGTDIAFGTVSGNFGAGIFVDAAADGTTITGMKVGTDESISNLVPNGGDGIEILGSGTTFDGGTVSGNADNGITVAGPATVVRRARIGDLSGSTPAGNADIGIHVTGAGVATIGGPVETDGNVISGGEDGGVTIDSAAGGTILQHNKIGTGSGGATEARYVNETGVRITDSPNNRVGTPGAGNLITNSELDGVAVAEDGSIGNRIEDNQIGSTSAFVDANARHGVSISGGATGTVIGSPGAGNTVTRNGEAGIAVADAASTGSVIKANFVGVTSAGTGLHGNVSDGIRVTGGDGAQIGGLAAGEGNISSSNGSDGIEVSNQADDAIVRGNIVGTNPAGTLGFPNNRGILIGAERAIVEGNAAAGNVTEGIELDAGSGHRVAGNQLGVSAAGAVIANGEEGLELDDVTGTVSATRSAATSEPGSARTTTWRASRSRTIRSPGTAGSESTSTPWSAAPPRTTPVTPTPAPTRSRTTRSSTPRPSTATRRR